ncbi:protease inhibitor I42 family protein [Treponema sp.]|uniref:protease inhibitor I42 family protein n=1 Tax=Treponema sp. TaxID=166 RepID=UPI00298E975D|nr:protease inhibitor I42 family protein [Treponema sp.]MCQ2241653.1 protease inhibitor I42 family protein [Treponema sp.]
MKKMLEWAFLGISGAVLFAGCLTSKFKSQDETIVLRGNPTTGYTWTYNLDDDGIFSIEETVTYLGADGIVGAPSMFEYKLKSLEPGETRIKFVYSRPWLEDSVIESKSFAIKVAASGKIEIKEAE